MIPPRNVTGNTTGVLIITLSEEVPCLTKNLTAALPALAPERRTGTTVGPLVPAAVGVLALPEAGPYHQLLPASTASSAIHRTNFCKRL